MPKRPPLLDKRPPLLDKRPPLLARPDEGGYSRYYSHVDYRDYDEGRSYSHDRRSGPPHRGVCNFPRVLIVLSLKFKIHVTKVCVQALEVEWARAACALVLLGLVFFAASPTPLCSRVSLYRSGLPGTCWPHVSASWVLQC